MTTSLSPSRPQQICAGAAQHEITPVIGLPMDGYGDRVGMAAGVHDVLWAKALVLRTSTRHLVLVSCDLVGIDTETVRIVRDRLGATGQGDWGVFLSATHTHAGPAGARAPVDETVASLVHTGALAAVEAALARCEPARIGAGWTTAPGIGANRRDPSIAYDPVVGVMRIDAEDGRPIAAMVNFACHPTVLSAENLLYSADYPGAVTSAMEQAIGGDVVAMFTNGAAGDVSTRFTRTASTFEEVERLGRQLARAAMGAYGQIMPSVATQVAFGTRTIELPPPALPPAEKVETDLESARRALAEAHATGAPPGQVRIAHTAVQGLERQMARARRGASDPVYAEIGAFSIDGIRAVAWPGEVFNAFAADLRHHAGGPVFVLGYTNGLIGYVPTPEAFAAGGYEATSARVGPAAGAHIVEVSRALLQDITKRV